MSARTIKRLLTEIAALEREPGVLRALGPKSEDNLFSWEAILEGPSGTAFEGQDLVVRIAIPATYPQSPPTMSFEPNAVFHPNVAFKSGEICLDVLKSRWSPVWSLVSACRAVHALLSSPEPSSPLNVDAANLLRCGDQKGFESLARMCIQLASDERRAT